MKIFWGILTIVLSVILAINWPYQDTIFSVWIAPLIGMACIGSLCYAVGHGSGHACHDRDCA